MRVLLIEGNAADVGLVRQGIAASEKSVELEVIQDGEEALEFLFRRGAYGQAPTPDLILLGLRLPRRTGFEILAELERDPDLKFLPVVVFSGSAQKAEVNRCYGLGANAYVVKPVDPTEFIEFVKAVIVFWHGCQFRKLNGRK